MSPPLFHGFIWPEDDPERTAAPAPTPRRTSLLSRLLFETHQVPLGESWEEDRYWEWKTLTRFGTGFFIVVTIVVIGGVFYLARALFPPLSRASDGFFRFLTSAWALPLGTLLLTGAATALYVLRVRHRTLYGIFEFSFAVVVGWIAIGNFARRTEAAGIGVIQAAYLMVRGIDNIMEGRKKAKALGNH